MNLSVGGGVEVRVGVGGRIEVEVEVVVLERVDALELARMGVFCGRGRWWMSYACEGVSDKSFEEWVGLGHTLRFTGSFRISNASWTWLKRAGVRVGGREGYGMQ